MSNFIWQDVDSNLSVLQYDLKAYDTIPDVEWKTETSVRKSYNTLCFKKASYAAVLPAQDLWIEVEAWVAQC